jgi:DNA-binding transcriptional ArsR family regulator
MTKARSPGHLDSVLGALSDPTRRALFEATLERPGLTTTELAAESRSISRWGVIKHLAVLRDAGLIQTMATGRLRRHYAESGALTGLRAWLGELP